RAQENPPVPAVSWDGAREAFASKLTPGGTIPPACIDAIVAHAQLRILTEEVPEIAKQAKADKDNHWRQDTTTPGVPEDGSPLTAEQCLSAFRDGWDGAAETVAQEVSTPAFAKLAAQASVVGSSAMAGSHAGIPGAVRSPLVWLRGATLGGFLFVRSWFAKPLAGLIFALLLVAAAAITILISSALAAFTVPVAVGVTVASSALLLGRGGHVWRGAWTAASVVAALIAALALWHHTGAHYSKATWALLGGGAVAIGAGVGALCEWRIPKLRLLVFLAGLVVTAGALICLRSSGPLLDWIANSAKQHWPIGLLSLAVSLPLVFGMRSLAAAVAAPADSPP
ncbi:MAG: hypothetical protein M3Q31_04415, partial [Actinomycetota bacterium]|nr:hypothetical protein [Actinomycetota bacterium]